MMVDFDLADPQSALVKYEASRVFGMNLADAIAFLPIRQRLVLALYFIEELSMREIGRVMEITESNVSELRSEALITLGAVKRVDLRRGEDRP